MNVRVKTGQPPQTIQTVNPDLYLCVDAASHLRPSRTCKSPRNIRLNAGHNDLFERRFNMEQMDGRQEEVLKYVHLSDSVTGSRDYNSLVSKTIQKKHPEVRRLAAIFCPDFVA